MGSPAVKPEQVVMIENGTFKDCLVSPRSAKEYDVPTNGAGAWESPESLDIAAGDIMYGINTGIGELSEVALTDEQVKEFKEFSGFGSDQETVRII